MHQEVGLSRNECGILLDDILEEIADALDADERVVISNFGSFTVRQKKERIGRNPKTGEEAVVSARRAVKFNASQELKHLVDQREK